MKIEKEFYKLIHYLRKKSEPHKVGCKCYLCGTMADMINDPLSWPDSSRVDLYGTPMPDKPEPEKWWVRNENGKYEIIKSLQGLDTHDWLIHGSILKHLRPDLKLPEPGQCIEIPAPLLKKEIYDRGQLLSDNESLRSLTTALESLNEKYHHKNEKLKDRLKNANNYEAVWAEKEQSLHQCLQLKIRNQKMRECLSKLRDNSPGCRVGDFAGWMEGTIDTCIESIDEATNEQ